MLCVRTSVQIHLHRGQRPERRQEERRPALHGVCRRRRSLGSGDEDGLASQQAARKCCNNCRAARQWRYDIARRFVPSPAQRFIRAH